MMNLNEFQVRMVWGAICGFITAMFMLDAPRYVALFAYVIVMLLTALVLKK